MSPSGDSDDDFNLIPADGLARAEAALARLAAEYLGWVGADVAAARACLTHPHDFSRLYTIVHDIKGQAGTFGYPLLTEIGARLCHLLCEPAPPLERVTALLDAMVLVVEQRLCDNGGVAGQELLARLD